MDIGLFDRNKKSFTTQRSKIRSNQAGNDYKRRPLTSFHHGRPLTHGRASRNRERQGASKPSKHMKQALSSWQEQASFISSSPSSVFHFYEPESEDYVNSRFRFVIRNGSAIAEDDDVPWNRVEHVRVPVFDSNYACPICLEPLVAARITRCGHIFCLPCILHHLHERPKCRCPLCFASIAEEDLRSMEFVRNQTVHVGDCIQMCLLARSKSQKHPLPADPNRTEIFSRFIKADSIDEIVERELCELKTAADSCQCQITASFISSAVTSVESRTSLWMMESHDELLGAVIPSIQEPADEVYYFYQNCDGSPVFMHSFNYRCLVEEYGTDFPSVICGNVLDVTQYEQTEENRSRFRFLRHLPLSMVFYIVELDINQALSQETIEKFRDEAIIRQLAREEKHRDSETANQQQKRRAEIMKIVKQGSPMPLQFHDPYPVPEVSSIECFPSLSSSPPLHVLNGKYCPRWSSPQPSPQTFGSYSVEDSESENDQLLHSFTPPDWNRIDFQITTRHKQKKQKPKK